MKTLVLALTAFAFGFGAYGKTREKQKTGELTFLECSVNEPISATKTAKVTAKIAIKNFDTDPELATYPGQDPDEYEAILVEPKQIGPKKHFSILTNLNAQGGDMRVEGSNLRFFGDGDGYQFTDLVIWDFDNLESEVLEGYIRDYGSAYGDSETFKQFIKCKKSSKKL